MTELCKEPISTGIFNHKPTFDECGRPVHKETGMCLEHAKEAKLVAKPLPLSVLARMAATQKARRAAVAAKAEREAETARREANEIVERMERRKAEQAARRESRFSS